MKTSFTQTVNQAVLKFASASMLAATFATANIASINVANAADVSTNTAMSATQSADWQQKHAQKMAERAAHMLKNAQAAANANINVNQAISIAQSQVTDGTAMHVFYGNKFKGKGKRANQNANQDSNQKAAYENAYHVGVKGADGQGYHVVVDANTGAILKKEQKQRRNQRGNNQSQQNTKPAVNLTTAMTTVANQVAGQAVSAGFGRMGKMGKSRLHGARQHGQRSQGFAKRSNRQGGQQHQRPNQRPDKNVTPSYHIQVLKNNQLYFVKVDAQTGKVIDSKTQAQMQQMLQEKLAKRQQKRHGNS